MRRRLDAVGDDRHQFTAPAGRGESVCAGCGRDDDTSGTPVRQADLEAPLRRADWVVYAKRPFGGPEAVLAYLAAGDRAAAEKALDAFVKDYPQSPRVPDLLYQRGRLLYSKGDFEASLKAFSAFVEAAPGHELLPSALYWGGESLFALGRLDEAERVFAAVVEKYPSSVKVEASSYRLELIKLEFRERELLKLLTWSHEESLRVVEDFRRRERSYEQAIAAYQRQAADAKRGLPADSGKTAAEQKARADELAARLAAAEGELAAARAALEAAKAGKPAEAKAPAPPAVLPSSAAQLSAEALAAKERALDLLAYYLENLPREEAK